MKHSACLSAVLALVATGCAPSANPMTNQNEQSPWVIRTEFSDDEKWSAVRELVAAPQNEMGQKFYAYVRFVSDEKYASMEIFLARR
jgi:hypothetical protein